MSSEPVHDTGQAIASQLARLDPRLDVVHLAPDARGLLHGMRGKLPSYMSVHGSFCTATERCLEDVVEIPCVAMVVENIGPTGAGLVNTMAYAINQHASHLRNLMRDDQSTIRVAIWGDPVRNAIRNGSIKIDVGIMGYPTSAGVVPRAFGLDVHSNLRVTNTSTGTQHVVRARDVVVAIDGTPVKHLTGFVVDIGHGNDTIILHSHLRAGIDSRLLTAVGTTITITANGPSDGEPLATISAEIVAAHTAAGVVTTLEIANVAGPDASVTIERATAAPNVRFDFGQGADPTVEIEGWADAVDAQGPLVRLTLSGPFDGLTLTVYRPAYMSDDEVVALVSRGIQDAGAIGNIGIAG